LFVCVTAGTAGCGFRGGRANGGCAAMADTAVTATERTINRIRMNYSLRLSRAGVKPDEKANETAAWERNPLNCHRSRSSIRAPETGNKTMFVGEPLT
jgi:hypothetical protein